MIEEALNDRRRGHDEDFSSGLEGGFHKSAGIALPAACLAEAVEQIVPGGGLREGFNIACVVSILRRACMAGIWNNLA